MNQHLKTIQDLLQQNKTLSDAEKEALLKTITDADKQWSITDFKLDRTEKVKKTTAILLEETIEELEQKRKAVEAQNRELEIESSLERVRAVAMGMKRSDDLLSICEVLFKELQTLGFSHLRNTLINTFVDEQHYFIDYNFSDFAGGSSSRIPYSGHPAIEKYIKGATKKNDAFIEMIVTGKELEDWKEFRRANGETDDPRLDNIAALYYYNYSIGVAGIGISTFQPITQEKLEVLKRFRNVFDLAYRRYTDIQQAEEQARESQIQLALERVRARTMAMQKSDELREAVLVIYEQLQHLNFESNACNIIIMDKESGSMQYWVSGFTQEIFPESYYVPYLNHPYHEAQLIPWRQGEKYAVIEISGKMKKSFDEIFFTQTEFRNIPEKAKEVMTGFKFVKFSTAYISYGALQVIGPESLSEEKANILQRFAKVFEQTYTRFLDLQKAEAQAKEAQIETALEKVRSRTLAMQKSDELAETAAVLFQQLIALGIEPNRLYISIVKDDNGETEFWITDEDGNKVSTAYTTNLNDNPTFSKMYEGWKQQKKSLVIDMQGEELNTYFRHLTNIGVPFKGGLSQKRRVQDIAYFSKGFIGMASPDDQPAETLQLLERFAYVFNLTFTRFSDLQIAEAHALQSEKDLIAIKEAKQKAEDALTELQATQKQLIQSEKMASLGELTAGIAHEIQNPLNFVNNFSEVSRELLDEMKIELDNGNTADAKDIASDVMQNLEKILHHGKRADGIVKGMLQHSRTSSGQKEPTDINMLADEYLRLAYHGLRAKDKSFNATLNHDFDRSIDKINLIPQDIGRVFVNLINNAFYAVNEKIKQHIPGYEPTVTITTKKVGDKAELRIMDNGNGVPKKVLDKIFQPFFTTKPTGQGTGLGLSLAYDIITKGHGGELKVETKEGEGTCFIISIPIIK
jgi:signal transduction histidine kinase